MLHLFNIPHLILTYGYIGIFIIAFLESGVFFMLPGDSLLFTAGLLASTHGFSLPLLIPLIPGKFPRRYRRIYLGYLHRAPSQI